MYVRRVGVEPAEFIPDYDICQDGLLCDFVLLSILQYPSGEEDSSFDPWLGKVSRALQRDAGCFLRDHHKCIQLIVDRSAQFQFIVDEKLLSVQQGEKQSRTSAGHVQSRSGQEGIRLDRALALFLRDRGVSRSRVQSLIKAGHVLVDGQVCLAARMRLSFGRRLQVRIPEDLGQIQAVSGPLEVLLQHKGVVAINKSWGISVHPAPGEKGPTLVNHMLARFPELKSLDPLRPGVVHRLDKDTSGVLLWALDEEVQQGLMTSFARRKVRKHYLALVHGRLDREQGEISLPLSRDGKRKTRMEVNRSGRPALTRYQCLSSFDNGRYSLLLLEILTGRTHQIRVHLAYLGHPVVGDRVYAPEQVAALRSRDPLLAKLVCRQLLHAWKIGLDHPVSGEPLEVSSCLPLDFCRVVLYVARQQVKGVFLSEGHETVLQGPCFNWDHLSLAEVEDMLWAQDGVLSEMCRRSFGERFWETDSSIKDELLRLLPGAGQRDLRELLVVFKPAVSQILHSFWDRSSGKKDCLAFFPGYLRDILHILQTDLGFVLGEGKLSDFLQQLQEMRRVQVRGLLSDLARYLPERLA